MRAGAAAAPVAIPADKRAERTHGDHERSRAKGGSQPSGARVASRRGTLRRVIPDRTEAHGVSQRRIPRTRLLARQRQGRDDLPLRPPWKASRSSTSIPKDDTPGCTVQACAVRDAWSDFESAGAVVLGVSPDGEESHVKFRDKFNLPFTLLSDPDRVAAKAYDVWVEKTNYGKTSMGIQRSTFVIDAAGNTARIFRNVKPDTHAEKVLEALAAL